MFPMGFDRVSLSPSLFASIASRLFVSLFILHYFCLAFPTFPHSRRYLDIFSRVHYTFLCLMPTSLLGIFSCLAPSISATHSRTLVTQERKNFEVTFRYLQETLGTSEKSQCPRMYRGYCWCRCAKRHYWQNISHNPLSYTRKAFTPCVDEKKKLFARSIFIWVGRYICGVGCASTKTQKRRYRSQSYIL